MKRIILLIMLILVGCADKKTINIGTASTTGALYPLGASMANTYNKNLPNIRVSSQATNGGLENLNLIRDGEIDASFGVSSILYQAYHGIGRFEGKENKDIRIIFGLYSNPNQVVVRKDILDFSNFKKRVFSTGAAGSTSEEEMKTHLDLKGINFDKDIKKSYINQSNASEMFKNKMIDGIWIMAGVPTASVTELLLTNDLTLLNMDDEFLDKLIKKYPWYSKFKIKSSDYENLDKDITTSSIKMLFYTRADVDEDIIYELTKTFWENIDKLKDENKSLSNLQIEDAVKGLSGLPLHEGAKKYYREINLKINQ